LEELAMAKKSGSKPMTKTEIMRSISETTNLAKKDVVAVMEALADEIQNALKGSGVGVFTIPGLIKIERKKIPARPAKKGVMVLGQLRDLPAKPASVKVRVRAPGLITMRAAPVYGAARSRCEPGLWAPVVGSGTASGRPHGRRPWPLSTAFLAVCQPRDVVAAE
jgi:nucleoid DNA-binding protein